MAKVTTPQNIPSELLDDYRATLGEVRPDDGVRKRYPYRVPTMQTLVGHPSTKQKAQRARFLIAEGNFAGVDWATRQRWYAAAPVWGSFLWYYNYFIMSSLGGNANPEQGGAGVVKSLKYYTFAIPTGAPQNVNVAIDAVDPTKTVVMLFGAGAYEAAEGAWVSVYPYPVSLVEELLVVKASLSNLGGFGGGAIVIEYI